MEGLTNIFCETFYPITAAASAPLAMEANFTNDSRCNQNQKAPFAVLTVFFYQFVMIAINKDLDLDHEERAGLRLQGFPSNIF